MRLLVFGYNRGPVPKADAVIDCRLLDNPHRHPRYRQMTGAAVEIQAYVSASQGFDKLWQRVVDTIMSLPDDATVAFGCAFGKHRSRAVAHLASRYLRSAGRDVEDISPYVYSNGVEEVLS